MSYHILHLLSPNLRVRLRLDQLLIADTEKKTENSVPLADVAVIVAAAPDMSVTASALRRMAELNVLLLICNEKFEPCALNLPYYRATSTELLRRQIEWTGDWKWQMWRRIVAAKVRNQAAVVKGSIRAHSALAEIVELCESRAGPSELPGSARPSLASVAPSQRAGLHSDDPYACESRAARIYWKYLLRRLGGKQETDETRREPGTRSGVNGMLDYGYAILRTAVLRSLAAHGFIAAIGIAHAAKAGSFALADDLMEPLRPWVDRRLAAFLQAGRRDMQEWIRDVVNILTEEHKASQGKIRLLNAIDLYVQSFAYAALLRQDHSLKIPMLPGAEGEFQGRARPPMSMSREKGTRSSCQQI